MDIFSDARYIYESAIERMRPGPAVTEALDGYNKKSYVVAIGKAAWDMADACVKALGENIIGGAVITKYGHARGPVGNLEIYEAGHPVPDDNTILATERVLAMLQGLSAEDSVILLISGGGSALFEKPEAGLTLSDIESVTKAILACGADIVEMNTIRKRLSAVKGGKFAAYVHPASIYAVVLSDIIGDKVEFIASGPVSPDSSTCLDALAVVEKYRLALPDKIMAYLNRETPKTLENAHTTVIGSVRLLCRAAADFAAVKGYRPIIYTDALTCAAADAGIYIGAIAKEVQAAGIYSPAALIFGGETVVKVKGRGKGGRNQELALYAAREIDGVSGADMLIFSVGSDGTDGPTDAAGGIVDRGTARKLRSRQMDLDAILAENDSYHGLEAVGGLIVTGPTGTNVNDLTVALIK